MLAAASIADLKKAAAASKIIANLPAQIETIVDKQTREQKPYREMVLRDAGDVLSLRVWSDHPAFEFCSQLVPGDFVLIEGEFWTSPNFGLEAKGWTVRLLEPDEKAALVAGPEALRQRQEADFRSIESAVRSLRDPRLHALCELFLNEYGERFRRTAAARAYHHARRGGLVEHVAQMLRAAEKMCEAYPSLNRDLLLAGVLFHDCGKLWENCYPKEGFLMKHEVLGELFGHISIGIELLNRFWSKLRTNPDFARWKELVPASEDVRVHLIHLVAAHHGEKQFGSPIEPKTPEALVLHFIDNLDAKLDAMTQAYRSGRRFAPDIVERVRPLPANLVVPLASLTSAPESAGEATLFDHAALVPPSTPSSSVSEKTPE